MALLPAVGERALHEAIDERDVDARGDDDELERAGRDPPVRLEERERRRTRGRLRRREDLERPPPVRIGRDGLRLTPGGVDDERAAAAAAVMRLEDRAGRPDRDLEALAGDGALVSVEKHGHLVARCILELLDHQLAAPGGRAPVHLAERVAPHVVANAVQLEARRPLQEHAPALLRVRAALGKELLERDEPRVDDERLRLALDDLRPRERERVLDRETHRIEGVPASWDPGELIPGRAIAAPGRRELDAALTEPAGALIGDERRRRHGRCGVHLQPDPDVVALHEVASDAVPAHVGRP